MKAHCAIAFLLCVATLSAGAREDYEQAKATMRAGDIESALDSFEKALRVEPESLRYASEYRQAVIRLDAYDRCFAFFEEVTNTHSDSANAFLSYGLAHVDKIPSAGSITQVLLANTAVGHFSKSIELEATWIGLYIRGRSYLFWPKVFNRAHLGLADLEQAYEIQKAEGGRRSLYARLYEALGDGHAKMDEFEKARSVWKEGLHEYPGHRGLKKRLSLNDEEVAAYIYELMDPNKRVDTDLSPLWADEGQ